MQRRVKFIALGLGVLLLFSACGKEKTPSEETTDSVTESVVLPTEGETEAPTLPKDPMEMQKEEFLKLVNELHPIGAWDLEADADGTVKDAVYGEAVKLQKGAQLAEGYAGNGLYTDSQTEGYADMGLNALALLNGKTAVTVCAWIMPYLNYHPKNFRVISIPLASDQYGIQLTYESEQLVLGIRTLKGEVLSTYAFPYDISNGKVGTLGKYSNDGQWQHVAVTLDYAAGKAEVFVNGMKIGSQPVVLSQKSFALRPITVPLTVGGTPKGDGSSFNGTVDNVFLFDRVLSGDEIYRLSKQSGTGSSPLSNQANLEKAVAKAGSSPMFYEGCPNLIENGMLHPLDAQHPELSAKKIGGLFYIPAAAAEGRFEKTDVASVKEGGAVYLSLKELCEKNGFYLFHSGKIYAAAPREKLFSEEQDAALLSALDAFFCGKTAVTPFRPVELTRTVVAKKGDLDGAVGNCATPSVVRVGDWIYASMDSGGKVYVYGSRDNGKSFQFLSVLNNLKFSSLFTLNGKLYLLGIEVAGRERYVAVTESLDGGKTWSEISATQGRLKPNEDGFAAHSSSTAVLITDGKIYKAFSGQAKTKTSYSWKSGCSGFMVSAPIDSDLLNPDSWTVSSSVKFDTGIYHQNPDSSPIPPYVYCQEPNAVKAPNGEIWAIYRVDSMPIPNCAIVMKLSADGKTLTYDPKDPDSMLNFPGGITKCTVRYDEKSGTYLALIDENLKPYTWAQRNVLSLAASKDLIHWTVRQELLLDRTVMDEFISISKHAFQYVDWVIDGDDLIFTVREAMGDTVRYHDANHLTFYRLPSFRQYLD